MKSLYFSWRTKAYCSLVGSELGHPQWLLPILEEQGRTRYAV